MTGDAHRLHNQRCDATAHHSTPQMIIDDAATRDSVVITNGFHVGGLYPSKLNYRPAAGSTCARAHQQPSDAFPFFLPGWMRRGSHACGLLVNYLSTSTDTSHMG